jgi:hypothetical protein
LLISSLWAELMHEKSVVVNKIIKIYSGESARVCKIKTFMEIKK